MILRRGSAVPEQPPSERALLELYAACLAFITRNFDQKLIAGDELSLNDLSPNERAASGALSSSPLGNLGIFQLRRSESESVR